MIMSGILGWTVALILHPPEEREMSERMVPAGWKGNFWGPEATKARHEGRMSPIVATQHMARWDRWGRQVLREGDILFRLGDARVGRGIFPMSRFLANASDSKFSHTGIVTIEQEGPVVYDTTRTGVARQPFCVWILDNVGSIGVKRLKPEYRKSIPKVVAYVRRVFEQQLPFDYELLPDDDALYCVEMTEKAFRSAGLELSKPIRLGDMDRASEFPVCMFGLQFASRYALKQPLTFDSLVFFPGNERNGIWAAKQLMTIVPPTWAPGHPDLSVGVPSTKIARDDGSPRPKATNPSAREGRSSTGRPGATAATPAT